jgi:hypothetical protein
MTYFLTEADKINTDNTKFDHIIHDDPNKYLNYLSQGFKTSFPKINLNCTSTKEIENIIKSLK